MRKVIDDYDNEDYDYFKEWDIEQYKQEIERLNKKIEQYENPEDMTLMFMWCDEKAKDEIKRLNNIINEVRKYCKNSSMTLKSHYFSDILKIINKEDE